MISYISWISEEKSISYTISIDHIVSIDWVIKGGHEIATCHMVNGSVITIHDPKASHKLHESIIQRGERP